MIEGNHGWGELDLGGMKTIYEIPSFGPLPLIPALHIKVLDVSSLRARFCSQSITLVYNGGVTPEETLLIYTEQMGPHSTVSQE